jgi:exodeoxyribonuclease V alpha subunit
VLTPANRGDLGTTSLNKAIQEKYNPFTDVESELSNTEVTFRIGDRVCQRVNNYNIDPYGVYNGDTGLVHSVEPREKTLTVELWDGRLITYKQSELGQLSLAYAITVHRSQGAEMPCVILALHESQFTLLERQLLYTAVTRAKKLLIVVGSKQALMIGAKRATSSKRFTALKERIQKR